MSNKDDLLVDHVDGGLNNMYSQMLAPFYALSNFFLNAANLHSDSMAEEPESKNLMFTIDASKVSPKVHSILLQKAQANELEDYIAELIAQDIGKTETKETNILFETLRGEFLSEINLLKQNQKEYTSNQNHNLREMVTQLGEQKLDKKEFQTLLNAFRCEILDQITLLKHELASFPEVARNPRNSSPAIEDSKAGDVKEGQILENSQVTGTIKEVIDVDF
jgi:hypothetical protein